MSKYRSAVPFSQRKIFTLLFLACLSAAFSLSFRTSIVMKKLAEGTIEFSVIPVDTAKNKPSFTIPDKMVMKFKNNYFSCEEECGLGMAKMKFITDPVKKEFRTAIIF